MKKSNIVLIMGLKCHPSQILHSEFPYNQYKIVVNMYVTVQFESDTNKNISQVRE